MSTQLPSASDDAADLERATNIAAFGSGFEVMLPEKQRAPFVFCSPHSGRIYPQSFLDGSNLSDMALRKSEDCFVDQLVDSVPELGVPLIKALFPRAYLDVNREPYELDPELFDETLPDYANTSSLRVAGGLGTIARIVADAEEIYAEPPSLAACLARVDQLYKPFHAELSGLLAATRDAFGEVILIDCHSMPSATAAQSFGVRPDFVLGDRFGTTCHGRLSRVFKEALTQRGYRVQLNRPYAGGFITEHYGKPIEGFHSLQIEINRALYMNEAKLKPNARFERLRTDLDAVFTQVVAHMTEVSLGQHGLLPRAAAE